MDTQERLALAVLMAQNDTSGIIKFIEKLEDDYILASSYKLRTLAQLREDLRRADEVIAQMKADQLESRRRAAQELEDLGHAQASHNELVRTLDVAINGQGAAKQASLCDVVAQVVKEGLVALPVKNICQLSVGGSHVTIVFADPDNAVALYHHITEKINANQPTMARGAAHRTGDLR